MRSKGIPMLKPLLLCSLFLRHGSKILAKQHLPAVHEVPTVDTDLASLLRTPRQEQEVISEALRIIQHMESAPTCNRLAALSLINECKSLEDGTDEAKKDSQNILDEVKSEYAARLAVCELLGAKARIPRDCSILIPSHEACDQGGLFSFGRRSRNRASINEICYPKATQAKFETCLKALADNAQSWTSYSNSRQNAVVMCRASRDVIEREKTLAIYKSLAEVVADLTSAYQDATNDLRHKMQTWLDEHMQFADEIRLSQTHIATEMKANQEMTRVTFHELSNQAQDLRQFLSGYESTIEQFQLFMRDIFRNISETSSRHTTTQLQELEIYHHTAISGLQHSINTFTQGLTTLSDSIDAVKEEADQTHQTLLTVREELSSVDLELKDIKSDTEKISTIIKESKEAFKTLAVVGKALTNPRWLVVAVIAYGGFLYGLWKLNRKLAGFILMGAGSCYLLHEYGSLRHGQNLMNYLKDLLMSQDTTSTVLYSSIILFLIAVILWSWAQWTHLCVFEDEKGTKRVLPRVEAPERSAPSRHQFKTLLGTLSSFW